MKHAANPSAARQDVAAAGEELSRDNRPDSPVVEALQTYGPHFRDLHRLFDRFAEDVLETLDPFAERIRMIGPDPPAHRLETTDLATVAPAAPASTMHEMVEEADANALIVVREVR